VLRILIIQVGQFNRSFLPSNNLIISTLYDTAGKWTAVLFVVSRTKTRVPFPVKEGRSSNLLFRKATFSRVAQNLLALFKAARISKSGFVASKVTNSAETIVVVMAHALVILTDIHLSIHMRKQPSEKQWCFDCQNNNISK
jgi:hypothetical protein